MTIMTIIVPLFIALIWGIIVFKIIAGIVIFNADGIIATAGFGELEGLTIAPYTYSTRTFYFSDDCIKRMNADLTESLICNSKTSNYY